MDRFEFNNRLKIILVGVFLLGAVALVVSFLGFSHDRVWSNILLNSYYFIAIALCAVFFISVNNIGFSGWQTSIQRIPEAMGMYLPVGAILFPVLIFGMDEVYHWTAEHTDAIIEHKKPYLNTPFFVIRMVVYLVGWSVIAYFMRKFSLKSDMDPDMKYYKRNQVLSAIFLVFFAITSSTSAWDWLMSIDTHWYSTLYGWYIFSSMFVSSIAMIILLTLFLEKNGVMPHLNKEHIHDLGKYLFGFSVFWMYLWFSQFMLIWYSNIPEETTYFIERLAHFDKLFWANVVVNFFFPFLVLLPRRFTWSRVPLVIASVAVLIGHWIDLYVAIMPGAVHDHHHTGISVPELGIPLLYLGLFLFVFFYFFSKAGVIPKNHPFFKESLEYHNI